MSICRIDFSTFKQDFKVSTEDKLKYGEIYTPFHLIQKILNLFEPAVYTDPHRTWLDVGAGRGYFSMLLFDRLNHGLIQCIPDETARHTHILTRMIHMIELKPSNCVALREMFGVNATIHSCDFGISEFPLDTYDYIIGNPPYNADGMKKVPTNKDRDKKQDGSTIWSIFIVKSLTLLKPGGQLAMIVPSLWLKPDKARMHSVMLQYKLEKIHCLASNETNAVFKGAAQTPTCYFLLTKTAATKVITLYDTQRQAYVAYPHTVGQPIPVFAAHVIQKIQPWLMKAGSLKVSKTNMPSVKSRFNDYPYNPAYPYVNITTCVLEGLQPVLLLNYSDIPQAFHGIKKLVLAHKMYGFPYLDKNGHYGIANRDNYVIIHKTDAQLEQIAAFLSTKFALYLFEAARYRMKYLEKYAFDFLPDITYLSDFPSLITDTSVADYFGLDEQDKTAIMGLHKNYERFMV